MSVKHPMVLLYSVVHLLFEQVQKYFIPSAHQAKNRLVVSLSNFELLKIQNLQSLPSSRCDWASLHRPTLIKICTRVGLNYNCNPWDMIDLHCSSLCVDWILVKGSMHI
jgi:hypothetical protein